MFEFYAILRPSYGARLFPLVPEETSRIIFRDARVIALRYWRSLPCRNMAPEAI
jgi:hypothetical protein